MTRNAWIGIVVLLILAAGLTYWLSKRMSGAWMWPVHGPVRSGYQRNRVNPVTGAVRDHLAIDIAVPVGTPVLAPRDGTVKSVYSAGDGGRQMVLEHRIGNNTWLTGYAHLSEWRVSEGDQVTQGDVIALSGNTGTSTGPHLHFTMTDPTGRKVDPITYLA